jgi:hypothetical protein
MKPLDQTQMAGKGVGGNCVQACVASILELPMEKVPHFLELAQTPDQWEVAFEDWLEQLGIGNVRLMSHFCFEGYYLCTGPTVRGTKHMCVYFDGRLAHDPHPSKSGLIEVEWTRLLVPLNVGRWKNEDTIPW